MSAAVALMLEGMPSPWDLHLHWAGGRVVVLVGSKVVAEYGEGDLGMRNMAIVTLRRVGFGGGRVAEVFGLTPTYVSRLKTAAARQGAAALGGQDGRQAAALDEDQQDLAQQWREQGNLIWRSAGGSGVAGTTVARRLAARPAAGADPGLRQEELEFAGPAPGPQQKPAAGSTGKEEQQEEEEPGCGAGLAGAGQGGADGKRRPCRRDRAGRGSPAGCSGRGMRGRCCCTRSRPVPGRGRCWIRGRGRARRRRVPVRRCGLAVGDQHVLRAGGCDDRAGQAPDGHVRAPPCRRAGTYC